MEQHIRNILTPKTKSAATLKNRTAYVFQLYRLLDSNASDLSFLNDKRAVMELVKNSDNLGTQKTRLFHIYETINLDKSKVVPVDIKDYYYNEADKLKTAVKTLEDTNIMNEKQKANHISIHSANLQLETHLKKVFTEYGMKTVNIIPDDVFNKYNDKSARKNVFTMAKAIQECVIPALYIWQTALRNDWAELTLTRKIIIPNTGNWLQLHKNGTMTIILNEYKNAKYFGKQRIQLNTKLNQLMLIWLNLLERILGKRPTHPLYYSINAKGEIRWISNAETLAKQLSRISTKLFGRAATINTFRHSHEMALQSSSEYQRMTVDERKKEHAKLLHSLETGQKYMLQRRD